MTGVLVVVSRFPIGPMRLAYLLSLEVEEVRELARRGQIEGAYKHPLTRDWCFPNPIRVRFPAAPKRR